MASSLTPFARDPVFWRLVGYALPIGLFAGLSGLVFVRLVAWGTRLLWPDDIDYGFMGGEVWWIGVTVAAGLLVGLLRRMLRVPRELPGAISGIEEARVDYRTAPAAFLVSIVSLVGGASLGPFDAGTRAGGGFADWMSARRGLPDDMREVNTLSGISGGVGALLTAPFLATLLPMELARPGMKRFYMVLVPNLVAAGVGFFVFYATLGATFLDIYAVPSYSVEVWHFGLAVVLGVLGALIAILMMAVRSVVRAVVTRLEAPAVLLAAAGGAAFGTTGVLFPLTLGSGKEQLAYALDHAGTLGTALLIGALVAKILAMAVSAETGFIGGPVMPTLFIGGLAGISVHLIFAELPLGLTLPALLVAVPGATIRAPFTMLLLAAFTVGVGPIASAPVGVAVLTAYVLTSGLGLIGSAKRTNGASAIEGREAGEMRCDKRDK